MVAIVYIILRLCDQTGKLGVHLTVELVGMGPPADTPASLLVHYHRPVVETDRRALVEQPAVGQPPALVTVEDLVDCVVAQVCLLLHLLDRKLHVLVLVHRSQQFGYTARRPREWGNRSNKFMPFLGSYFHNKIGTLPRTAVWTCESSGKHNTSK